MDLEHPDILLELFKVRQRELWKEAEMRALVRQAEAARPRRHKRGLLALGESLMSSGLKIKARLQPTTPSPVEGERHASCAVLTTSPRGAVSTPLADQESPYREPCAEEMACGERV